MPANYTTTIKNARLQVVLDAIKAGGGPGKLEIGTAGMATVLATIELSANAGVISAGVLTLETPVSDISADATGTAALARIRDVSNADVVTGLSVGTSGANININATAISLGQTITLASATIVHG